MESKEAEETQRERAAAAKDPSLVPHILATASSMAKTTPYIIMSANEQPATTEQTGYEYLATPFPIMTYRTAM